MALQSRESSATFLSRIMISLFYNMALEGNLLLAMLLIKKKNISWIETHAASVRLFFFCSSLCMNAPICFNYFPLVALLSHAAKLPHANGASDKMQCCQISKKI